MREIKFRAWDEEEKKMSEPFSLFDMDGGYCVAIGKDILGTYKEDKPWPIMQFTGLKDKNGVEIYEGDIIKYGASHHEVYFGEMALPSGLGCAATFALRKIPSGQNGSLQYWSQDIYEVVGNIYDLLK